MGVLVHLYRMRLAVHPLQELLALLGIAAGVAMVFAVLVANNGLTGSVEQLSRGITGHATLEVAARGPDGMDERIARRIAELPSVRTAAPVLEVQGEAVGPAGRQAIDFLGVQQSSMISLGGSLLNDLGGVRLVQGVALPEGVVSALGVHTGGSVVLQIGGYAERVPVGAVMTTDQIHALSDSPIAVAPLPAAQLLAGMPGRITRVFVAPATGTARSLAHDLRRVAGSGLDVRPANTEAHLAEQAAGPNDQLTAVFAGVSAIVGVLLAFNAMLLTMPERRRFVAMLRVQGFTRGGVLSVLAFEALVLAIAASILGLLLGDLLSHTLFRAVPGYLRFAFPVGTQQIVDFSSLALAFGIGMAATLLATGRPVLDLYSRRPVDAPLSHEPQTSTRRPSRARPLLLVVAAVLLALTVAVSRVASAATMAAIGALVLAMLFVVPGCLAAVLRIADRLSYRLPRRGGLLGLSISELRATGTRSVALAATMAVAVFGSVALEGSRRDLLRGLDQNFVGNLHTADLAMAPAGDENLLFTEPLRPLPTSHMNSRLGSKAGRDIRTIRQFQASVLDLPNRRVWVNARPPDERTMIAPGELVKGNLAVASRELRSGGWAAVSTAIADEEHLHIGQRFSIPTPSGTSPFRLAAIITNLGWPPGAILMNTNDYQRDWRTSQPTAIEIDVRRGVSPQRAKADLLAALGSAEESVSPPPPLAAKLGFNHPVVVRSGLTVQTADERTAVAERLARQGLDRLRQITLLVLIGALAAAAAALAGALWQRRSWLAALRAQGVERAQLWQGLLMETGLVVALGTVLGAAFGLYGQLLLTRWLRLTTGFPAPYSLAAWLALGLLALMAILTITVGAVPGYFAARVPPGLSFQE
jgi:putative ABC transport system permease protein